MVTPEEGWKQEDIEELAEMLELIEDTEHLGQIQAIARSRILREASIVLKKKNPEVFKWVYNLFKKAQEAKAKTSEAKTQIPTKGEARKETSETINHARNKQEFVEAVEDLWKPISTAKNNSGQGIEPKRGNCGKEARDIRKNFSALNRDVESSTNGVTNTAVQVSALTTELQSSNQLDNWMETEYGLSADVLEDIYQQQEVLEREEAEGQKKGKGQKERLEKIAPGVKVRILSEGDYKGMVGEVVSVIAGGLKAWIAVVTGYSNSTSDYRRSKAVVKDTLIPTCHLKLI